MTAQAFIIGATLMIVPALPIAASGSNTEEELVLVDFATLDGSRTTVDIPLAGRVRG